MRPMHARYVLPQRARSCVDNLKRERLHVILDLEVAISVAF